MLNGSELFCCHVCRIREEVARILSAARLRVVANMLKNVIVVVEELEN